MRRTLIGCAAALFACTPKDQPQPADSPAAGSSGVDDAANGTSVVMSDSAGRQLGTLVVAEVDSVLTITGELRGISPGTHAIHIHTIGACQPTFASAGDHWNPTSREHGTTNPRGPHMGDMPNVVVGQDSVAVVAVRTPGGTLRRQNAIVDADGSSVVVHASADDYRTDPSGDSGDRIACGVLQR